MTRLLPLLAIMVLFLGLVSVVHAQTTTPTVSTVAVTSDPGSDNTYTTLDVITVGVTFSEAVTVTGTPQITLDIGGTERTADYSGAGTATGQLLFSYTVQPVDQDDDGVAVKVNSLALNGGTIQSADDSTSATLTHSAMAFPSHKVDTELVLISNMGQADGTALRINAGETVRLSFDYWNSIVIYDLNQIVLDVKTPSDNLNLAVSTVINVPVEAISPHLVATFEGSVATAGRQTFKSNDFSVAVLDSSEGTQLFITTDEADLYLTATGTGYVELGTTASTDEDAAGAYRWSIGDSVYRSTDGGTTYTEQTSAHLPRFSVVGHTTETLRILAADIVSEPYNGTAYVAGEQIEARISLNGPVRSTADPLTVPLHLGEEPQHRREARLVNTVGDYTSYSLGVGSPQLRRYVLYFAYTVQTGDVDADGIVLGADPLGTESDGKIEYGLDTRIRMDLSFPAQTPGASQRVDGSQTSGCVDVHCANVIADGTALGTGYSVPSVDTGEIAGGISGRLFSYGGHEYFLRQASVTVREGVGIGYIGNDMIVVLSNPLQERGAQRLGWQVGGLTFAFADHGDGFTSPAPTSEEEGFEQIDVYIWPITGSRWNIGERVLIKIVEMPVTATFDAASYAGDEGGSVEVTVTLGGSFETKTVTLPIRAAGSGGATAADYSGVPESLVFAPGETEKSFTVTLTDDDVDDDGESLTLSFGTESNIKSGGANKTATVAINDNDDPEVTVSFGAATYTAAEGSTATVTVTLSADPERTVEVPITTTNQGGASAADYSGVPATVTFNSGDTSKPITFAATQDTEDDDDESVLLGFGSSLPARVSAGTTAETTVSIRDDDDPAVTVSFGAAAYTAAEGGTATVTVTLSADPERTVEVPITTTNQGGASAADYSGVPATVTFNSGDTSKPITFAAAQDTEDDDDESVLLGFGSSLPARVSAGRTAETTVSIRDDDDPQVKVSFGAATYTAAEGGTATVTVTLSADPERTVEVPITTTNQGGASAADYSGVPATVTFNSGDTSKPITFAAAQDTEDDDDESVLLGFGSSLPARVSAGTTAETTVSIRDDDDPQVKVSFGAATYTAAEGGTATVTVTLSADPERTVEVPITTTNQGGASAADYSGVPATVTFNSGDTSKPITFAAAQDTEDDDDESVLLGFGSSLPARVSAGTTAETTVSIRDDDDPQVKVSFGAATYTAAEGGTATVTVTLSADPERTVEVPITTTNQGGASAADYSGVPATVTFNSGDTSKPITFAATQDTEDDDDESVLLGFGSSLPARVSAGTTAETTVSIRDDDDPAVTVSFGAAAYTAAEGGTATVTVTLSADPERTVEVPITTTNQGGASAADYSGVPATVTFNSGDTSKPITFAATQDTEDDDDESVLLGFGSSLPARVSAGTTAETTVSIRDDADPAVTVSFGASTYTAAEGGTATVTVTLSADPERTVAVPITTTNQGGASAADYSGVPATVTFNSGDTSKPITFAAAQDTEDDDDESVLLGFGSSLPARVSAGTTAETTVSIRDDDDPAVTVSFGASTYTAAEGGTATVTVTLSADPERTVEVPITTTNQGGASAADYSGVPATVTFNSGDTSKTFTFTATQEMGDDEGESVKIAFGKLPSGVSMGSPSETTVTIRQVSTEFILSCGLAVWCADMRFSDGTAVDWGWSRLRYEKDWDPPATVSDDTFTFRGVEYTLRRVDVHPGTYPIMPNAWSRTKQGYSYISLRITRGDYWDPPPREHYRDWVLHLDGLELPFKDAFRAGDEFQWIGVAFQELFNDWISSTVTKIGIEEVAATAQEPTPALPYAPIAVEAFAAGRNALYVRWDPPWWRVGVPDATGYIVQWKEAADSWSDSAAVSQREVRGGWQGLQQLDGLTEGALFSVRVFATNAAGDGPPSEDTLGRPQPLNPRLDSTSVNGGTLTMRYDRQLDRTSVPASTAFVVLANGGLRTVDTVAVRGMEVVLTLAEGVSAANSVIARYEPPTDPAAAFLRDTEGNHVFTSKRDGLKEVANETPRSSLQPLTASFSNVPSSHDGSGSFTFNIGFSEPVWIGTGFPRAHLPVVTGGTVTSAHWLERRTDEWAVTVRPDGSGDIVITLPKDRYCVADLDDSIRQEDLVAGAPCAAGNRPLTNEPTATVTGTSSEQHDATENTPAEGAPRLDGDPAVGETLFAGTTGITDAEGLNHAVFAYQWLADDAEIDGATGSTYTPTSGDAGKTITVRVTFTDDAGNEESLTSAATEAVAAGLDLRSATLDGATLTLNYNEILDSSVTLPATAFTVSLNGESRSVSAVSVSGSAVTLTLASEAAAGDTVTVDYVRPEGRHFIRDIRGRVAPSFSGRVVSNDTAPDQPEESEEQADPLTASAHGVPASHDGSAAFTFELRFSETPADGFSYKTLRDHAFTVTGGEVVKARRLERGKNVRWEITIRPDGDGTVTIVLPVTEDCASNHAICTEDGRPLSNRLQIAVPGPEG